MGDSMATRQRHGEWDLTVSYLPDRGDYWWNAWHEPTSTELSGHCDGQVAAWEAAREAMNGAPVSRPALRLVS